MLNRIVLTEKNQISTLKVIDELRHVDIQPAMHAIEKGIASSNSQKVNLDINNLQVISHATQELLGLVIRHVRLQNIPITISGSSQLDPGILLAISEGKPQLLEQQNQEKDTFTIKPKYFSRFSTPFFSNEKENSDNQSLIHDLDVAQKNVDKEHKLYLEGKLEDTEDSLRGDVSAKYSHWLLFGRILFFGLTCVALMLLIMLWPEYQSGKIQEVLINDNKSSFVENDKLAGSSNIKKWSKSSLMQAVRKNDMTETENLIAAGATLDSKDHIGYTPLMHAVKQQNTGMVKLLADHGANVNISDDLGDTPLVWASSMKNEAIVKVLLENGADPDKGNFSPLMWAAFHGNLPMLKMFLEYRANLNLRTHEGWTALMWAAEKGNLHVLWELLNRGAIVNMQNNSGQTALMLAAGRGRIGPVGLLLNKGGDASVVDFNKNNAVDYARVEQRKEVLLLLLKEFD